MSDENLFFDLKKLKKLGKNVIIGKTARIRHPEFCKIDDRSIIDDFVYVSTKLLVGKNTHIASDVSIGGGKDFTCSIGSYTGISVGVKIWCASNDFINDIIGILPKEVDNVGITGNVNIGNYTGIGSNSVIMPNVTISEGASIGALSLIMPNTILKPWTYYAGIPAKPMKKRNKKQILKQVEISKKYEI
jgi:acetyltransferase-like isoleucine patch superfamily enzyme|tara:strand:+ start:351 stop:917 length:567 start_codon:yes stop_codon:yes gene_type:complete